MIPRSSGQNCKWARLWYGIAAICAALTVGLVSLSASGQDLAQLAECDKRATTQADATVCASEEAARADAELNAVYEKLLSRARGQQKAVSKIREAQRAWVTFRDAYADAMFPLEDKQAKYGSVYPMEVNLVRAKLTRAQIVALRDLVRQYTGPQ